MKATPRSFVPRLGLLHQRRFPRRSRCARAKRCAGAGPRAGDHRRGNTQTTAGTDELALSALYPGISVDETRAAVGWPLAIEESPVAVPRPTPDELTALRALHTRTAAAHARPVHIPNRSFSDVSHPESHRG
jgi:glutaconate CoA-transferase subunit B